MKINFTSHRNDLFSEDIKCTCPSPNFIGSSIEHLMKRTIRLSGYNDSYFFNIVNKEPRKYTCVCGRTFDYQWKDDGVYITNDSLTK